VHKFRVGDDVIYLPPMTDRNKRAKIIKIDNAAAYQKYRLEFEVGGFRWVADRDIMLEPVDNDALHNWLKWK
jgi:hypothetical protein